MANSSFISLEAELASIDITAKQEEQANANEIKDKLL